MTLYKFILFGLSTLLFLGSSHPLHAQTDISPPDGAWTHAATGTAFPQAADGYTRARIVEYDNDNNSIGYAYRDSNGELTFTIYLYPSFPNVGCEEEFAGVKAALNSYPGLVLIGESKAPPPDGTGSMNAAVARYRIPAGAMRKDLPEMVSDAYLYCSRDKRWLVKYRASWTGNEATFPDIGKLMRAIPWPSVLRDAD